MQLTNFVRKGKSVNESNNKKSKWNWSRDWKILCACSALLLGHIAEGAQKFYSVIEDGEVAATYKNDKRFSFSREENSRIIKSILEKLPMAQSATLVSSSKPLRSADIENATLNYKMRDIKQVHLVAVSFARSDLLPIMYFQVKEQWRDCDTESEYCLENVSLEFTGPSKLVRDLNDFGAFPTSLNVMNMTVKLDNERTSFEPDSSPATVSWTMGFREVENGIEDYLRYFRSKASKSEQRITLQNVRGAMALWAAQVSRTAFNKVEN